MNIKNQKSIRILLYIDQKRRDEYGILRIMHELRKSEILEIKVAGKLDFLLHVMYWKPQVILYGKHDGYHGDWLRCISNAHIICLNTEQGYDKLEDIYNVFVDGHAYPRPPAADKVDYFLLYSHRMKEVLKQWLPENKLIVVGSPRVYVSRPSQNACVLKNRPFTIGIALGADVGDQNEILTFFDAYKEKSVAFDEYNNIQGFISYSVLERLWLEYLVKQLSQNNQIIVRPRFCNRLLNPAFEPQNIFYDYSNDLTFLIQHSDLIILGQSTLGIETTMVGIPSISIVKFINPGMSYDKIISRNFIRPLWQPRNLSDLMVLIEKRKRNKLSLSPNMLEYKRVVKDHFYGGYEEDNSIKLLSNLIFSLEYKPGADLDLERYKQLLGVSKLYYSLALIKYLRKKWLYNLLLRYSRFRIWRQNKINKNHDFYIACN